MVTEEHTASHSAVHLCDLNIVSNKTLYFLTNIPMQNLNWKVENRKSKERRCTTNLDRKLEKQKNNKCLMNKTEEG